ncbi:MAG: sugar ABC transporter substrate-binding protein [Verrucomicrobia bacterium]|nr:sugar ABC transporter substrate-binding protein [Verrucomicrobiota bacterium]
MNSSPSPFQCKDFSDVPTLRRDRTPRMLQYLTGLSCNPGRQCRHVRIVLLFACAFLLMASNRIFICSAQSTPSSEAKGNLVLFDFGDANDKQIRDAAIARFNKRFPNVQVIDQFTPISSWGDYLDKLVTQVVSGKAPDLIHIATEGFELAVRRKLVIPLDELDSDPTGKALLTDVDPALVKGFTAEGKLYLVPVAWNNMMVYYNTKVFNQAGISRPSDDWTWDDFLQVAKRLTSGDGSAKRFGFGIPYFNFGLTPFWYSNDTSVLKNDLKESNLDDPKFLESLTFVHDLVRKNGVSPDPANTDPNAVFQLFASGKIAMTGGGHWPMQFFKANNFSDFDVVPWPKNKVQKTVFGADGWGISTKTKQKAIALEMLKELVSVESQQQAAGLGVAIPARRSVAESKEFLAQPEHAALFYDSLRSAAPVQAPANYAEVERILMRHLSQVMADEVNPEDALKAANEELSAAMQQEAAEDQ